MKTAIDWFVEEQYDISLATGVKADIDAFIAHLRYEQIQDMMSQPDGIIMCSELDGLPAAVKCEECCFGPLSLKLLHSCQPVFPLFNVVSRSAWTSSAWRDLLGATLPENAVSTVHSKWSSRFVWAFSFQVPSMSFVGSLKSTFL